MTDPIHQIDEAYRRATPGEWESNKWRVFARESDAGTLDLVAQTATNAATRVARRQSDADFIALAHNHWPAVMAEIERLRSLLAAKETPHAE